MIGLEIINDKELIKGFENYKAEAEKAIDKAVSDTAKAIETTAKERVRKFLTNANEYIVSKSGKKTKSMRGSGGSGLLGSIYNRPVESMEKVVGSNKHYAPYIEFGTGELVFTNFVFDEEAKKVAAQFKGKKKIKGIRGFSFLNYAAVNQRLKLVERIKTNLNKIQK